MNENISKTTIDMNECIRETIVKAVLEATDIDVVKYWLAELKCLDEILRQDYAHAGDDE